MSDQIIETDLSIVIVNWNTQALLDACLASVFRHLGDLSIQVIVIDNGSTDGSVALVQSTYPQVELIQNSANRGFAAANNQAFGQCRGRYWLLLNTDTEILDNVLINCVRALDKEANVGALGCQVLNTDGSRQISDRPFPGLRYLSAKLLGLHKFMPKPAIADVSADAPMRDVETLSGCFLMVRRQAVEAIGPMDASYFFFGEETEWCMRFRAGGWRVCQAPLGNITHHGGGSSKPLSYKRDVMLTEAIIRLHHQCRGAMSARLAWFLLMKFNTSRAVFWGTIGWLLKPAIAADRARHFWQVSKAVPTLWQATSGATIGAPTPNRLEDPEAA
ncbi:MAG: glycosyltransferase family 2 protein [Alphaproteobacteria bacterium]|nr:glycosyltransferase family 2 protein [Alphaproteobacteria bacterium SS10]